MRIFLPNTSLRALCLLPALALGACDPKLKLGEVLEGDQLADSSSTGGDGVSSTGGGMVSATGSSAGVTETGEAGTSGAGSTTRSGSTGAGTMEAGTGESAEGGDGSTAASTDGPVDPPAACAEVDHATCFPAAIDACAGEGNWNVSQACVDAVTACYPLGTAALAPADIIGFCAAEVDGQCLFNDEPGCSETYCACTAGAFPFDWNNCWHLTLLACRLDSPSDCQAVLDGCYPGHTPEQYEVCRQQVMDQVGSECDCPMCSIHDACEAGLDACLGG